MIIAKPKKVKLILMSNEIEAIIDELNRVNHNLYKFMDYANVIRKLKKALK